MNGICSVRAVTMNSCPIATFRKPSGECQVCTACEGGREAAPCQAFQDTICIADDIVNPRSAHERRVFEERFRLDVQRARKYLSVEMTRMESLVYEWQMSVFVISIIITCALLLSCCSLAICRTRTVVRKGMEDYNHLLNRGPHGGVMDRLDQGTLAYANFEHTKIGPCADDSPYGPSSHTVCVKSSTPSRVSANYMRLPQCSV